MKWIGATKSAWLKFSELTKRMRSILDVLNMDNIDRVEKLILLSIQNLMSLFDCVNKLWGNYGFRDWSQ